MSEQRAPYNEIDDYIATFSAEERAELAAAEAAIDLAFLLHQARQAHGLSQTAAAERAGLKQQAVSRLEQPGANVQLDTVRRYLGALGYTLDLTVRETQTGRVLGNASLPPIPRPATRAKPARRYGTRRLATG